MRKYRKKLIQFGAGNIGRAFIGQVFAREGYETVFIDVNNSLIAELNKMREYRVVSKTNDTPDVTYMVRNVRAIHSRETERIMQEICSADLISTSVGKGVLSKIIPIISKGIMARYIKTPEKPIDIIIAENIRNGKNYFTEELLRHLPDSFPLEEFVGLIETSIGKSVPIMKKKDIENDPLWVFSESYNKLILAKNELKSILPDTRNIMQVSNIQAYVDRKLFIHNLGHVSAAYFGYLYYPTISDLSSILRKEKIYKKVRSAMNESAAALVAEYPEIFDKDELLEHIDDLIERFQNHALGDTIFRVGKDLNRKLEKSDRLVGAALLCRKHRLSDDTITEAIASGFYFLASDETGTRLKSDIAFHKLQKSNGIDYVLSKKCHLRKQVPAERDLAQKIIEKFTIVMEKK